jgi:hypothetical protein
MAESKADILKRLKEQRFVKETTPGQKKDPLPKKVDMKKLEKLADKETVKPKRKYKKRKPK